LDMAKWGRHNFTEKYQWSFWRSVNNIPYNEHRHLFWYKKRVLPKSMAGLSYKRN
jgi:hypothetical protein